MIFPSRYLSPHLYDFLEALITQQTSPDEAYRKFDAISSKHTEQLRKYTKQVSLYYTVQVQIGTNQMFCAQEKQLQAKTKIRKMCIYYVLHCICIHCHARCSIYFIYLIRYVFLSKPRQACLLYLQNIENYSVFFLRLCRCGRPVTITMTNL